MTRGRRSTDQWNRHGSVVQQHLVLGLNRHGHRNHHLCNMVPRSAFLKFATQSYLRSVYSPPPSQFSMFRTPINPISTTVEPFMTAFVVGALLFYSCWNIYFTTVWFLVLRRLNVYAMIHLCVWVVVLSILSGFFSNAFSNDCDFDTQSVYKMTTLPRK
jgi:hypothetical protein